MAKKSIAPKRKTFLHKEVIFSKETGSTFEALLRAALRKQVDVVSRMQEGENPGQKRFINYHLLHGAGRGSIFGCEFLGYESGADQSIILMSSGTKELNVDAIPAGPNREFLDGSVYLGAKGNHVILFQSMGLRTIELEGYLNWLLREKSNVIDEDTALTLQDHISAKKRQQLKGVKGIKLKTPLVAKAAIQPTDKEGTSEREMTVVPRGNPWDALKSILGEGIELPSTISGRRITEISDLEIQVYLRWKGRHKEDDNQFLDSIASQLRHVQDEFDYEIDSKHGTISKKKIKLAQAFSVPWTESGRPKFDWLFPKMAEWLEYLVNDGSVDA